MSTVTCYLLVRSWLTTMVTLDQLEQLDHSMIHVKKSVQVASRKPELQNCKVALVLRCFKFFLLYAGILMCQYSESVFVDRIVKCVLLSKIAFCDLMCIVFCKIDW